MKVQLRNVMSVQCSSEFFITLLIAADEDCLVQSKRTATKYIIYFSGIVNNSFSPIIGNSITDLISSDVCTCEITYDIQQKVIPLVLEKSLAK